MQSFGSFFSCQADVTDFIISLLLCDDGTSFVLIIRIVLHNSWWCDTTRFFPRVYTYTHSHWLVRVWYAFYFWYLEAHVTHLIMKNFHLHSFSFHLTLSMSWFKQYKNENLMFFFYSRSSSDYLTRLLKKIMNLMIHLHKSWMKISQKWFFVNACA